MTRTHWFPFGHQVKIVVFVILWNLWVVEFCLKKTRMNLTWSYFWFFIVVDVGFDKFPKYRKYFTNIFNSPLNLNISVPFNSTLLSPLTSSKINLWNILILYIVCRFAWITDFKLENWLSFSIRVCCKFAGENPNIIFVFDACFFVWRKIRQTATRAS